MRIDCLSYEEAEGKFYKRRNRVAYINSSNVIVWENGRSISSKVIASKDDWHECKETGELLGISYPKWFKAKQNGAIIRFEGLQEGTIVAEGKTCEKGASGVREELGFSATTWAKHTDTSTWIEVDEPVRYPIYKTFNSSGVVIEFTGLNVGKVVKSATTNNSGSTKGIYQALGSKDGNFAAHTDKHWITVAKPYTDAVEGEPEYGTPEYFDYWDLIYSKEEEGSIIIHQLDPGTKEYYWLSIHIEPSSWKEFNCRFSYEKIPTPEIMSYLQKTTKASVVVPKTKCTKFKVGENVKNIKSGNTYIIEHVNYLDYILDNNGRIHYTNEDAFELVNKINEGNEMKETKSNQVKDAVAVLTEALCGEVKEKKQKTPFQSRQGYVAVVYDRDGNPRAPYACGKNEAKKFFKVPSSIGMTIVIFKELKATTTSIPLVEVK